MNVGTYSSIFNQSVIINLDLIQAILLVQSLTGLLSLVFVPVLVPVLVPGQPKSIRCINIPKKLHQVYRARRRRGHCQDDAPALSNQRLVVSRKVPSKTISILLFVNGGIIIIGENMISLEANFSSEDISSMARNVIVGLLLTGL